MTENKRAFKVALIADTSLQQHLVANLLSEQDIEVVININPQRFSADMLEQEVDLWFVDLLTDGDWDDFLSIILDVSEVPVIIGDGQAPARNSEEYPRWRRRFLAMLSDNLVKAPQRETLLDDVDVSQGHAEKLPEVFKDLDFDSSQVPSRVWVLGASLGGPGAVKAFLDALPGGLPVAFVYAQHIDQSFQQVLADTVGRHSAYKVTLGGHGAALCYGQVTLVPVAKEVEFNSQAQMLVTDRCWQGAYQPCIGQVMQNTLKRFGASSGAIIFSGMGEDGAEASLNFAQRGAQVWAQSASSCANSTMPDAIGEVIHDCLRGTPVQLAKQLVQHLANDFKREEPKHNAL